MYTPCRSHRPTDHAVRSATDAIRSLVLATDDGHDRCIVVATVDGDRRPVMMMIFDHPTTVDGDLEAALGAVLQALTEVDSAIDAVFLASSRPGSEPGPTSDDEEQWLRMADACADAGIELLDWFVLSDGAVCSVAEGLDPGPGW